MATPDTYGRVVGTPHVPGYQLLAKIGEGGMSTVWKAYDFAHQCLVAIKILKSEFADQCADIHAFRGEERMMEEIHHRGVVQAYAFGISAGCWYLVMEYVDGYNFSTHLRRKQFVPETDCLLICESVADALAFVWNEHGVVHCDIKPENIMINTEGIVKLTDLGISHRFGVGGEVELPAQVVGTPAYISPEQVYGDVEPDCRSDIYALGATLYHLATGRVLFPGVNAEAIMRAHCDESCQAPDARTFHPELSLGFCQMLESMLVKDREERTQTWEDVLAVCREVESGGWFDPRETAGVSSLRLGA